MGWGGVPCCVVCACFPLVRRVREAPPLLCLGRGGGLRRRSSRFFFSRSTLGAHTVLFSSVRFRLRSTTKARLAPLSPLSHHPTTRPSCRLTPTAALAAGAGEFEGGGGWLFRAGNKQCSACRGSARGEAPQAILPRSHRRAGRLQAPSTPPLTRPRPRAVVCTRLHPRKRGVGVGRGGRGWGFFVCAVCAPARPI